MKSNFFRSKALALPMLALGVFSLTQCKNAEPATEPDVISVDVSLMDTTVNPGEDFFQYANGGWLKNNPIPETEYRWTAFNELAERNRAILKKVLEEAAAKTDAVKGTNEQKIGDFYASGMDSAKIEKDGIAPLKDELARIDAVKDVKGFIETVAQQQRKGIRTLFSFYVDQDAKKSTEYAPYANQGGLGLPERDYYFNNDERSKNIRAEYIKHIANMFVLLGETQTAAEAKAKTIFDLETRLAKASMTKVERRDPDKTYNKMTIEELNKLAPKMEWNHYLASVGIPPVKEVIVGQPNFFKEANNVLASAKVDDLKTYLRWNLIRSTASDISTAFVTESFSFNGTVLNGVKAQEPRWKRILKQSDNSLGEVLGQEYVKTAFTPEAKEKMLVLVGNLKDALKEKIQGLEWMSDATKKEALNKLSTFVTKIGYPDKWKDYSKLEINRDAYVLNVMRANEFEFQENMDKIGKPIDRNEWGMTPPTVNAYYNPAMNEIVFPAGILQPPYFDPKADDALNYGGIGAVIGHELTHGFDDEGRKFDAHGNLADWWTKEDADKYAVHTTVVKEQFNGYKVIDDMHVNGELTLGENIADLGGLTIAYAAYKKSLIGKEAPVIKGFTGDQRFFISWAQVWRSNYRPEALAKQLLTDPHSPGKYRVLGPLANIPEFHKAFNLKEGQPMVRPEMLRAKIW